jgi:hypothetical protein
VRCDYYVFMTAVADFGLVTKKCLCFTNLQTCFHFAHPKHSVESRMLYPHSVID